MLRAFRESLVMRERGGQRGCKGATYTGRSDRPIGVAYPRTVYLNQECLVLPIGRKHRQYSAWRRRKASLASRALFLLGPAV